MKRLCGARKSQNTGIIVVVSDVSAYNSTGHSYLLYESYIDDELLLYGLAGAMIEITDVELDILLDYHKDYNYYNLVYHNCSMVAIRAWNVVTEEVYFDKTIFPRELKKNIEKLEGSHSVSLLRNWGIR